MFVANWILGPVEFGAGAGAVAAVGWARSVTSENIKIELVINVFKTNSSLNNLTYLLLP